MALEKYPAGKLVAVTYILLVTDPVPPENPPGRRFQHNCLRTRPHHRHLYSMEVGDAAELRHIPQLTRPHHEHGSRQHRVLCNRPQSSRRCDAPRLLPEDAEQLRLAVLLRSGVEELPVEAQQLT